MCGRYRPHEKFVQDIQTGSRYPLEKRYLYSGAVRELFERSNQPVETGDDLDVLLDSVAIPTTVIEKIDRLLLYIANKCPDAYSPIAIDNSVMPITYAKTPLELTFFLNSAYTLTYMDETGSDEFHRLSVFGWRRVDEISKVRRDATQAFVAMSFNPDLYAIWQNGFEPALRETGYNPIRVDTKLTMDKIDDKIIADIRKSGLVVADFTENKNGVYFEAGFALGLGVPLIWTCRNTDIKKLHFDTNHYPHIDWKDADDLKSKLVNRIEATLPNRPRLKK